MAPASCARLPDIVVLSMKLPLLAERVSATSPPATYASLRVIAEYLAIVGPSATAPPPRACPFGE